MRRWNHFAWSAILIVVMVLGMLNAAPAMAQTFSIAPGGNDGNPGTDAQPWASLQHAADVVTPGAVVIVQPGTYVGAKFTRSGTSAAPIIFSAQPGAVINAPGPSNTNGDNLWIRNAHYIVLRGFEVHSAPRTGIAIQGEPTAPAKGNLVLQNFCHNNGRWGIFTGYALDVTIAENETSFSNLEHGIYVSNSADNPIIRNNVVHHNHASGIQINADPLLPGDKIISNALIEANLVYENGVGGGAAINLASVRNSLVRNNLLYENHASGIAGWDDGVARRWGTKNNKFLNNTVVMAADGRFAVSLAHGSTGNTILNNILFHRGSRGSIEIDQSSRGRLRSDYNVVVNRFSFNEVFITFAQWQAKKLDAHSLLVTSLNSLFVNPAGADYHLAPGSPAVDAGSASAGVSTDLDGQPRPQGAGYDIGAYEQ